jgi:hypothetical protein
MTSQPPWRGKFPVPPASSARRSFTPGPEGRPTRADQFGSFQASLLYCPTCRQATPTRERLLLVLPTGNLYEYRCAQCGTSTGSKTERDRPEVRLFLP